MPEGLNLEDLADWWYDQCGTIALISGLEVRGVKTTIHHLLPGEHPCKNDPDRHAIMGAAVFDDNAEGFATEVCLRCVTEQELGKMATVMKDGAMAYRAGDN